uniref:Lsr2-like DNA bridging protein n=1 Tax=Streptomyces phage Kamino TaxID=3158857 RepID=A0AAU7GXZ7_9CAUD
MAQVQVTVCDIDPTEVGKPTTRYTITRDGDRAEMDLCKDHAGPIETLLYEVDKSGAKVKAVPVKRAAAKKATTTSRRRGSAKIMTLEEIEAMKTS